MPDTLDNRETRAADGMTVAPWRSCGGLTSAAAALTMAPRHRREADAGLTQYTAGSARTRKPPPGTLA